MVGTSNNNKYIFFVGWFNDYKFSFKVNKLSMK
jgi:hypothetical protein